MPRARTRRPSTSDALNQNEDDFGIIESVRRGFRVGFADSVEGKNVTIEIAGAMVISINCQHSPPTSPWAALLSGPSHQIDVLKFQLEVGHFLRQ